MASSDVLFQYQSWLAVEAYSGAKRGPSAHDPRNVCMNYLLTHVGINNGVVGVSTIADKNPNVLGGICDTRI